MKIREYKYLILTLCALLSFSRIVPAQPQLPPLPVDSRIQKGTLGCGVTYYMVTDPTVKGYADVAIVQRDEPLSAAKRSTLKPQLLSRLSIAPGPDGYLLDTDGSTVYRFCRVPFYRAEALDSTLLYTFGLVAQSKAQQAVIVSGDIDAVELKKKLDIFSMLVPRMLVKNSHQPDYVWEPSPAPSVQFYPDGCARVSVTYNGARIPFPYMNTAQALVTDLFGLEFQVLLQHRLERNFRAAGIPYGSIDFHALRSADYGDDERYTVSMRVAQENLHETMRLMSNTIAELDAVGASPEEFAEAKKVLMPAIYHKWASAPTPGSLVNRCIAHFLYGANLAPYEETVRLFSRKNVSDSVETRLFNRFADALLEQLSNLTLEYRQAPDSLDKDEELFYYNLSYLYGSVVRTGNDYRWHGADTLGMQVKCPKVKVKNERQEAVTGGTLWTFSNGMRVIFKQVPKTGIFNYELQLNGGLAQIDDLQEGEGGYIGDLLSLYDAGGLPAWHFREVLEVGGVSMDTRVDLNNMAVSGVAPSTQLPFLIKALLELANHGKLNLEACEAYRQQQLLRETGIDDALSLRLVPDYRYTNARIPSALSAETWKKAEKFYADRFARMNDGVLIISGDLNEVSVKKLLSQYLGGFRVLKGVTPRRPVEYSPRVGTLTVTESGPEKGIFVLMEAEYPATAAHFYTSYIAQDLLQKCLTGRLVKYGFSSQVEVTPLVHPRERFQVRISCRPLPLGHVPADVNEISAQRTLSAVRAAIKDASSELADAADMALWKAKLNSSVEQVMASSSGFVTTLHARYAWNKDVTSHFKENIAAITPEDVQSFMKSMAAGGRVEYLVP